jgi:hypothetical protein
VGNASDAPKSSSTAVDWLRNFFPVNKGPDLPRLFSGHVFDDTSLVRRGVGTGILIRSDGLLFTNAHVVKDCEKLVVANRHGALQAKVEKVSNRADVALLRLSLNIPSHSAKAFFTLADPVPAERVKVFGFPLADFVGSAGSFSEGIINTDNVRDPSLFQVSAQVHSGNSGSAIVNGRGELVGLVTSKLDPIKFAQKTGELVQGINFGVKSRELSFLLPTLVVQSPPVGALSQVNKWFSPRDEQITFALDHFSVRIDCMASVKLPEWRAGPQPRTYQSRSAEASSAPAENQRLPSPSGVGERNKQRTALKLVSIEKVGPFRSFFVHNNGSASVFRVRIGYFFSSGGSCPSDVGEYDGVASIAVLIPAGVTERAISDGIPEKARSFCVINESH